MTLLWTRKEEHGDQIYLFLKKLLSLIEGKPFKKYVHHFQKNVVCFGKRHPEFFFVANLQTNLGSISCSNIFLLIFYAIAIRVANSEADKIDLCKLVAQYADMHLLSIKQDFISFYYEAVLNFKGSSALAPRKRKFILLRQVTGRVHSEYIDPCRQFSLKELVRLLKVKPSSQCQFKKRLT
jgi:hypothetical protein